MKSKLLYNHNRSCSDSCINVISQLIGLCKPILIGGLTRHKAAFGDHVSSVVEFICFVSQSVALPHLVLISRTVQSAGWLDDITGSCPAHMCRSIEYLLVLRWAQNGCAYSIKTWMFSPELGMGGDRTGEWRDVCSYQVYQLLENGMTNILEIITFYSSSSYKLAIFPSPSS